MEEIVNRMADTSIDGDERRRLMGEMQRIREQAARSRQRGRDGNRGGRGDRGRGRGGMGPPEEHPDGTFALDALQEGIYEVHVEAEEFARFESEEVQVRLAAAPPMMRITVDPGVYCAGIVVDHLGDPVAGAEVELRSDQPASQQPRPTGNNGNQRGRMPDFGRMAADWMRRSQGRGVRLEARTDENGEFIITHAPRGTYRLSAGADGFADVRTDVFELQIDRSDFELNIEPLGSIVGTVTGVLPDEIAETRVGAVLMPEDGRMPNLMGGRGGRGGGRGFRTVQVEPDGSYRIDDLAPGEYVVRSWVGSPQQLMRELGPKFFDGSLLADAAVKGGTETRFDLALTRPAVGTVAGSVMHNGSNASGFRVELRRQSNDGTADTAATGGRGNPMARFMNMGRSFNGTVDADGRFTIKNVTAGTYTLRIRSSRRGGTLLEEVVQVVADAVAERTYALQDCLAARHADDR